MEFLTVNLVCRSASTGAAHQPFARAAVMVRILAPALIRVAAQDEIPGEARAWVRVLIPVWVQTSVQTSAPTFAPCEVRGAIQVSAQVAVQAFAQTSALDALPDEFRAVSLACFPVEHQESARWSALTSL